MPAVRDLDRLRRAEPRSLGVRPRSIPANDSDVGMRSEPIPHGLAGAAGQEIEDATPFQIADDRAVAPAPPPSPVVDPDHTRGRAPCALATADQSQDGVAADRHGKPSRQAGAGFAAERHADIGLCLGQAIAALCPRTGEAGNRLGKDAARTMAAAEAAYLHPPRDRAILPGQVLQGSPVRAMHPGRPSPTMRTGCAGCGSPGRDRQRIGVQRKLVDLHTF